jgi:hypothetical protein
VTPSAGTKRARKDGGGDSPRRGRAVRDHELAALNERLSAVREALLAVARVMCRPASMRSRGVAITCGLTTACLEELWSRSIGTRSRSAQPGGPAVRRPVRRHRRAFLRQSRARGPAGQRVPRPALPARGRDDPEDRDPPRVRAPSGDAAARARRRARGGSDDRR